MSNIFAGLTRSGFALAALVAVVTAGKAAAVRSPEQAADQVQSEGFGLISKTDKAPGSWEVWASKDGIPYRVRVDAESGLVIAAVPAQDND